METLMKVSYQGKELEGILIKEDKEYLTLKLKSGYNANLRKSELKILETKKSEKGTRKSEVIKPNPKLPKVFIIHTGGTIASKVDYATGAVSSQFTPEELLSLYPELHEVANIETKMIGNLFSEDMRMEHHNLMLTEIEKALKSNPIGIIVSHGTDTMHYTSAALQYAISGLKIPILLVGAQRSSDRASSDAYLNLKAAMHFLTWNAKQDLAFRRVGICMHSSINDNGYAVLDGINAKKMHSSRRDAFRQINYPPFAEIDESGKVDVLRAELLSGASLGKTEFTPYDTKLRVGFFKSHPGLVPQELEMLSFYDAVIVEATGLGNLPVNEVDEHTKIHKKNLEAIRTLIKGGTKIIVGLQTVYGATNMNVYSSGRYLLETGVYGNYMNLTTETLFIRTLHCLSKNKKHFEILWNENLEGFAMRDVDMFED